MFKLHHAFVIASLLSIALSGSVLAEETIKADADTTTQTTEPVTPKLCSTKNKRAAKTTIKTEEKSEVNDIKSDDTSTTDDDSLASN